MTLCTAAHRRRSKMGCTDVFDVTAAAWLTRCRCICMMRPNPMAAEAGGVRHVAAHSDHRKPACTWEKWLMACIASLRKDSVLRRERTSGESNRTPRCGDSDPHESSYEGNECELPLPQTDRRTLFEVVQVVTLGDRL